MLLQKFSIRERSACPFFFGGVSTAIKIIFENLHASTYDDVKESFLFDKLYLTIFSKPSS